MMQNLFGTLAKHIQSGLDPRTLLNQMAQNDPGVAQAMGMIRGKNEQQLRTMAQNMARERGTSVEQVAQSLGLKLPK